MDSKIKSFEDACKALGLDPAVLPVVAALPELHQKALIAHYQLIIIAQALNEGWQPDWSNYREYKYFPWFEVEASKEQPAGFGFSDSDCVFSDTDACVGSRLCYKTADLARYAGKQFEELYKDYFLIG